MKGEEKFPGYFREIFPEYEDHPNENPASDLLQFVREMLYVQGYEAKKYCPLKGRKGLRSDCLVCQFVTLVPYPPFVLCGYGIEDGDLEQDDL